MSVLILPSQVHQPPGNGLITYTSGLDEGKTVETDAFICCHHGGIILVHIGSGKKRGFCFNCMDVHCGGEKCWECRPFEAWLEAMEATSINRRRLWSRLEEGGIKGVY